MAGGLINGFNDMRCSACGGKVGWFGLIEQPPKCHCGHDMTEDAKGLEAKLTKARNEALAEMRRENNG